MTPLVAEHLADVRRRRRTRWLDLVLDVAILVIAVGGIAGLTGGERWGLLLVALTVAGLVGQLLISLRRHSGGWTPMGKSLVARALAAAGVAIALSGGRGGRPAAIAALAAAVLIAVLAGEPYLRRAARFRVPVVSALPGIEPAPPMKDYTFPTVLASLGATALGVVVAALQASPIWWLVIAVLALVPAMLLAAAGRAKILRTRRQRAAVPAAVAAYAPEFVVYTSRPDDASYQVTMWLPYLRRAGKRFLIVTRNGEPARALAALTDVPVVEARRFGDLEALVTPSLQAAFYVNASSGNGAFVRYQHLTHIYLGHGDSDKAPSYNPTHAMYDQIFAAGPAAIRRYAAHGVRIPVEKFRIVGRPQVEGVQPATGPVSAVATPTALYAPTWRGHVEETMLYSLPEGERIVAALLHRGARVIFRPHPFSHDFPEDAATIGRINALLAEDRARSGREHLWGAAAETERSILDCINASDAMVSDVSSVVSDYLFSGKPFAMVAVPAEPDAFAAEYPVARASYILRGDLGNLDAVLSDLLGRDPLEPERRAIRVDYLGDLPAEHYADTFVSAVHSVSGKAEEDIESEEVLDAGGGDGGDGGEGGANGGEGGEGDEAAGPGTTRWRGYVRILTTAGLHLLGSALAAVAFGLALLQAPVGLVAVVGVAAIAPALGSRRRTVRRRRRWGRLLTRSDLARAVLLATLAVAGRQAGISPGALTAALILLGLALVGERHVRAAWGRLGLEVVGLPALRAEVRDWIPRGLLPMSGFVAILVAFVLVAARAAAPTARPDWAAAVLLAVAAAVVVVLAIVLARALLRADRVQVAEAKLSEALEQHAPEFAVYFASTVGAAYQVGMWLPYFQRIGRPYVVITRTVPMLKEIARVTAAAGVEVPIIYRPTLRSVEEVIVPSLTTAFYVNNAVRNTHFVERRELTHVWLNHGDSEKPACYNPVHAIYDLIFAAGQAGIDRYARHGVVIPAEKFRIVGRPQVEAIAPARGPIGQQRPLTVLYAPTWQGPYADTRVYSLPMGRQIVEHLLARGARVIFRAHPFNYRYRECREMIADIGRVLAEDRARTGREHLWGPEAESQLTVEDCFNASDAMISDVSAVVSDFLQSDKPFAMVSVGRTPAQLLVDAPAARAAYVLEQDLSNLAEVCTDLLERDPAALRRRETKVYYLGDFPAESYAEGFLSAARRVIDRQDGISEVAPPEPAPSLTAAPAQASAEHPVPAAGH